MSESKDVRLNRIGRQLEEANKSIDHAIRLASPLGNLSKKQSDILRARVLGTLALLGGLLGECGVNL